jgi:hypothetical protein
MMISHARPINHFVIQHKQQHTGWSKKHRLHLKKKCIFQKMIFSNQKSLDFKRHTFECEFRLKKEKHNNVLKYSISEIMYLQKRFEFFAGTIYSCIYNNRVSVFSMFHIP